MSRFRSLIVFCLLAASSCHQAPQHIDVAHTETSPKPLEPFFAPIPITKFSRSDCPSIDIEIEGKMVPIELDLGFRGDLTLAPEMIDQLALKAFSHIQTMYGMRGHECSVRLYRIPTVKIGAVTIRDLFLQEEDPSFRKHSLFVKDGREPALRDPGRVGWELFYNANLLLDISHGQIACCDSLETLCKEGYPVDDFVEVSLHLERGAVEFDIVTPEGSLRCMLDTGSTWNCLNHDLETGVSLDEAMWDTRHLLECSSLHIGGQDFGPATFHRIPLQAPIHIEAILGMEFIQEHLIFIDFSNQVLYLRKNS